MLEPVRFRAWRGNLTPREDGRPHRPDSAVSSSVCLEDDTMTPPHSHHASACRCGPRTPAPADAPHSVVRVKGSAGRLRRAGGDLVRAAGVAGIDRYRHPGPGHRRRTGRRRRRRNGLAGRFPRRGDRARVCGAFAVIFGMGRAPPSPGRNRRSSADRRPTTPAPGARQRVAPSSSSRADFPLPPPISSSEFARRTGPAVLPAGARL